MLRIKVSLHLFDSVANDPLTSPCISEYVLSSLTWNYTLSYQNTSVCSKYTHTANRKDFIYLQRLSVIAATLLSSAITRWCWRNSHRRLQHLTLQLGLCNFMQCLLDLNQQLFTLCYDIFQLLCCFLVLHLQPLQTCKLGRKITFAWHALTSKQLSFTILHTAIITLSWVSTLWYCQYLWFIYT